MAAKGEVRVTSYFLATDTLLMRRAVKGARGRIERVTPIPATNPSTVEMVSVFPSSDGYTDFQTRVEDQSRKNRGKNAEPGQRRFGRAAA